MGVWGPFFLTQPFLLLPSAFHCGSRNDPSIQGQAYPFCSADGITFADRVSREESMPFLNLSSISIGHHPIGRQSRAFHQLFHRHFRIVPSPHRLLGFLPTGSRAMCLSSRGEETRSHDRLSIGFQSTSLAVDGQA